MKKVNFIIELTKTGFSAYAEDFENYPITTTGTTIKELTTNLAEAMELHLDYANNKSAGMPEITWNFDLAQLFDYYKVINVSALGDRIGMSKSLLSQYIKGGKKASNKQVNRILTGVKDLGQELARIQIGG